MHYMQTEGRLMGKIISRNEFEEILKSSLSPYSYDRKKVPVKINCLYDETTLWEYSLQDGEVIFKNVQEYQKEILESLDMCGSLKLRTSFSDDYKDVENEKWTEWFLNKVSNSYLILDTNFIYRHYCSSVLAPILENAFESLEFKIPRMVILEIERRGNEKEKKGTKLSGKQKRLAFYAAREIEFIRKNSLHFDLLKLSERSLMADFADVAGKGFADMGIRSEIHAAWREDPIFRGYAPNHFFFTCDLMNSMAAEAEGIRSCYFSRLSQKNFHVGFYNIKQLFDFLMANAVIFGRIRLEYMSKETVVVETYGLEGAWEGKTTSDWYSDSIKFSK